MKAPFVVLLLALVAFADEDPSNQNLRRGLGPNEYKIPTDELAWLAKIGSARKYHELFLALSLPEENTMTRLTAQQEDNGWGELIVRAEGIPLLPIVSPYQPLAKFMSNIARLVWTGKNFQIPSRGNNPEDIASYTNIYLDKHFWTGHVYQGTIQEAMAGRGRNEKDPGLEMKQFASIGKIELDRKESVIIDYKNGDLGWFMDLVDECRPLDAAIIEGQGLSIDGDVDRAKLGDLWLCRSTIPKFLQFGPRVFFINFAVQFIPETVKDSGRGD